jgi:hypothetical protein
VSEDYKLQLSIKKGQDMVNVRANTVTELQALIDEAKTKDDLKGFFGAAVPKAPAVVVQDVTDEVKVPTDIEALENIEKHLGASTTSTVKLASKVQILVAAKKSGKSVDELQGISEADAKLLIAGGK